MVVLRLINVSGVAVLHSLNSCSTQIQENLEALHASVLFCDPHEASNTLKAIHKCWMFHLRQAVNFKDSCVQYAHRKGSAVALSSALEILT